MLAESIRSAVPLALVLLATSLGSGCSRLAEHPLVIEAVEELRANPRVAEAVGEPVGCGRSVRGTANETDGIAQLEFDVSGPKGSAVAKVEGKKTRGEWGVTHLKLEQPGGESLALTADLEARTGVDTPVFDPTAAPATQSNAPPPPEEIEITLPPGPPGS
jgi:hypothetical protein